MCVYVSVCMYVCMCVLIFTISQRLPTSPFLKLPYFTLKLKVYLQLQSNRKWKERDHNIIVGLRYLK